MYDAHIVFFFLKKYLKVSPMYIIGHFVQFVLYSPAFVLLLFLSCFVLTIFLIVLEGVVMNFISRLDKLFSIIAVMKVELGV